MQWKTFSTTRRCLVGWFAALALVAAPYVCANPVPICVSSDSDLAAVLNLAQRRPVQIQLVQRTYDLASTVWNRKGHTLGYAKLISGTSVEGGYTDSTCISRSVDANNTTFTDSTADPDNWIVLYGNATLDGVTFNLANGLLIYVDESFDGPVAADTQVTVRRSIFTGASGASTLPLEIYWNEDASLGGTVRFVNNLVHDNSGGGSAHANPAGIFFNLAGGKPTIELVNNTVVDNGGSLGGFGMLNLSETPVFADNNIFYGNSGPDFSIFYGMQITLVDNVIGTHSYAGTLANSGTTTGNPKLGVDFHPIESPPSPAINTGTENAIGGLPTTDLRGRDREVGSAPDRGAFESSIDDSVVQVVTTVNDAEPALVGSLRAAINSANAHPSKTTRIKFNLGSMCPYVIAPKTALPNITAPTTIDGYSQTGALVNTIANGDNAQLCVILDGTPHHLADGFMVPATAADTTALTVSGIAFSGFSHGALSLYGGSGHKLTGSRIGGTVGAITLDPVANGVIIGAGVHDSTIGGGSTLSDFDLRNIIGEATGDGIVINGPAGSTAAGNANLIVNNFIGVGWGSAAGGTFVNRGNAGNGITIAGSKNDIQFNLIAYNGGAGVYLVGQAASGNEIYGNDIGYLDPTQTVNSGNETGIVVNNSSHDNKMVDNLVYYNIDAGDFIVSGQRNLLADETFGNGGLGVDLGTAGVSPNDNDSDSHPADYANTAINFPELTGAIGGHFNGKFTGKLTTIPGQHWVYLYASQSCDPSGYGEGQNLLAEIPLVEGTQVVAGQVTDTFTYEFGSDVDFRTYPVITTTALDSVGNTSEFSKCFHYTDDTIFADDFGD